MSLVKDIGYVIATPVNQDKPAVISFLNDNLILVNSNESNEQLISTMFNSFEADPKLFEKYVNWLNDKYGSFRNFVGEDTSSSSGDSGGFGFNMGSITNLLGSAANIFATIKSSDAALAAAKAQAAATNNAANAANTNSATNLEIAKLQLQAMIQGNSKGGNTALYVILGVVGFGIVGTMIYFVARKK